MVLLHPAGTSLRPGDLRSMASGWRPSAKTPDARWPRSRPFPGWRWLPRYHLRTAWILNGTRESFWSLLNIHPDVCSMVINLPGVVHGSPDCVPMDHLPPRAPSLCQAASPEFFTVSISAAAHLQVAISFQANGCSLAEDRTSPLGPSPQGRCFFGTQWRTMKVVFIGDDPRSPS